VSGLSPQSEAAKTPWTRVALLLSMAKAARTSLVFVSQRPAVARPEMRIKRLKAWASGAFCVAA
jgi:hypothetical protein